jgi:teichuronic acid exporter
MQQYDPDISRRKSLSSLAARSSFLLFIAKAIRYTFAFIVQLILMNLLMPSDFGIIRCVTLIIGIINLLNEMGLSFAIIQKKSLLESELSSAFSFNALLGSGIYILLFFSAPACASYFNNNQLTALIRVGAFASFFGSLSVVHRSLLQRRLKYGRLTVIEICSAIAGSGAAVILALFGFGVWSLLASMIIFNVLSSLLFFMTTSWPQGNYLNISSAKTLSWFGGAVVFQRVLNYGAQNFDYLVVGKAFGEKSLGIYSIAHTLMALPQLALGVIIGNILLSAFSRIQDENQRLISAFLKVSIFISVLATPYFVLIFSFAREMMHTVNFLKHADTWIPAAVPLQILALLGLLLCYTSYPGTLWLSKGKIRLRIVWDFIMLLTVILAVFVGKPHGINGICWALTIRGIFFFPITLIITDRVIGLKPVIYFEMLLPSFACGLGMLLLTMPFSRIIPGASFGRDLIILSFGSVGGIALYFLLLFLFFKNTWKSFLEIAVSLKTAIQ